MIKANSQSAQGGCPLTELTVGAATTKDKSEITTAVQMYLMCANHQL